VRYKFNNSIKYGALLEDNFIYQVEKTPYIDNNLPQIAESNTRVSLNAVELLAPCQPGKIIAIAINYHGATGLTEKNNEPLVFIKPSSSVIGPNATIVSPFRDRNVWGEPELAIVIGKKISEATVEEACEAIFGYTVGNDVSCENVNGWDHHLARSKGPDTFCVLGPWIDTEYEPYNNYVRGYHNEILLREGKSQKRLWSEPELLVWLSSWMTLEPGDVVLTGTPSRVRDRIYFKEGDVFRCVIDELGEISNPFEFKK